jgi:hypothetical protein
VLLWNAVSELLDLNPETMTQMDVIVAVAKKKSGSEGGGFDKTWHPSNMPIIQLLVVLVVVGVVLYLLTMIPMDATIRTIAW